VDFRNAIMIMTSNLGTREAAKSMEFGFTGEKTVSYDKMSSKMLEEVKIMFRPEFLNRLDEIVVFKMLEREHVDKILTIYIEDINKRIADRGIKISLNQKARDYLIDQGYKPEVGARLMRRTVERYLEDPLAEEILKSKFTEGSTICVGIKNEQITFKEKTEKVPESATDSE
jgi:ATP-dependent Clp protease ATP-binding subunit ClpC